jgi:hypothetical protein
MRCNAMQGMLFLTPPGLLLQYYSSTLARYTCGRIIHTTLESDGGVDASCLSTCVIVYM